VLATVASVCGDTCAADVLHLTAEHSGLVPPPSACLPALAAGLRTAQAAQLAGALRSREPFGVAIPSATPTGTSDGSSTSAAVRDVFIATNESVHGAPVYAGLQTRMRAAACAEGSLPAIADRTPPSAIADGADRSPPSAWVITASHDPGAWQRCDGLASLDLTTGVARTSGGTVVPIAAHAGLGPCAAVLPFREVAGGADAVTFDRTASAAACWLMQFFGPLSAVGAPGADTSAEVVVEFDVGAAAVELVADLIVRAGQRLVLRASGAGGARAELRVGRRRVHVARGAEVVLERLRLTGSVGASAVLLTRTPALLALYSIIVYSKAAAFCECSNGSCPQQLATISNSVAHPASRRFHHSYPRARLVVPRLTSSPALRLAARRFYPPATPRSRLASERAPGASAHVGTKKRLK
jgi:hypothetical protein